MPKTRKKTRKTAGHSYPAGPRAGLTAAVAELFARDDCRLSGWTGILCGSADVSSSPMVSALVMTNPGVTAVSVLSMSSGMTSARSGYYKLNSLVALGVYNIPDDKIRMTLLDGMLRTMAAGGNLYMTVKMSLRDGSHRKKYFSKDELAAELSPHFKSVEVVQLANKWTQLAICREKL